MGLGPLGWAVIVAAVVSIAVAVRTAWLARQRELAAVADAQLASRMKNDFVSMVSHELRTPLTSIAGFASTLSDAWQDLDPSEVDEFVNLITREAEHLSELVEDILVIPRLEAGRLKMRPEIVDLGGLTREVRDVVFAMNGLDGVDISIPVGTKVYADRRRVRQILRNLLDNARKYGGNQVLVEGSQVGESFMVVVADNGPGVPEDQRDLIFRHFEQLSKGDARTTQGIGLGLPIARNLAQAMGGDLWYEARFPTGARFHLTIPTIQPGDERAEDPASVDFTWKVS